MRCFVFSLAAFAVNLVSALSYHGADFSSLLLLESTTNIQYTACGDAAPRPFEQILHDSGVNLARIRIWTAGTYDLAYGLELARRAQDAGMELLIDLHYDDTWADGGHQAIPSAWPTDLQGLIYQIYDYTHGVLDAFNAQGTPIKFIQIGNEIRDGLLWPTGQISINGFAGASKLLHAGVLAVRDASPFTKTVIHLDNGWDTATISYFYSGIFDACDSQEDFGSCLERSDVDVMGFSFYPFYGTNATLSKLKQSMKHVVSKYNKEIMIIETDFPAVCDTTITPLSEPDIPADVEGQIMWAEDIRAVLDDVNAVHPDKALGIVYWEPGWIGNAGLGSACADNLLVTSTGEARESMNMFWDM